MSKRAAAAAAATKEVGGSEQGKKALDKVDILENEANAISLAKTKVAYSRCGEGEDTLIVRDMYSGTRFDRFGVKGIARLERIFYTILATLSEHRTTLLKRMRYGGDALRNLLDGLSDEDRDGMSSAHDALTPLIKIELKKIETCPQVAMLQYDDDDDKSLKNGIYLYVSEVVKLVKHMNSVFAFSKSESLTMVKVVPIEKYTDDDFF